MKIIEYLKLYNYLIHNEKLRSWEAIYTINKVRKVAPEILIAIKEWSSGIVPNVAINEVSYSELINEEDMKPIQAFLFLDWLKREPISAMRFMESERLRSPIPPLSKGESETVSDAIKILEKQGVKSNNVIIPDSLENLPPEQKSDIELS